MNGGVDPESVGGRLVYLSESLASLHASPDLAWLAGRFEFMGEKAIGAALTVLALPDEQGLFRASASAAPRPATARDLWEELDLDNLGTNRPAALAFASAERAAAAIAVRAADIFYKTSVRGIDEAVLAPAIFNRELMAVGLFVVPATELNLQMANILAQHAAVAIHQIRQREEARRLHSVDSRLWIPDEHYLLTELRREVGRAHRYRREVGLLLLRLENEAEVRARFGSFLVDHMLRRIGSQIMASVRESDIVGALDGGFAVIHTDTPFDGTLASASKLKYSVARMIAQRFPEAPPPQISSQVAAYPATASDADALVAQVTARDGSGGQRLAA